MTSSKAEMEFKRMREEHFRNEEIRKQQEFQKSKKLKSKPKTKWNFDKIL